MISRIIGEMSMELEFHCVDAFSDVPHQGAPILVFPRAEGLAEAQMYRIVREFGYDNTVFMRRDGVAPHWHLHLFDQDANLQPFVGHSTVAAAAVVIHAGLVPTVEGETAFSFSLPIGEFDLRVYCEGGHVVCSTFRTQCDHAVDDYSPSLIDIAAVLGLPNSELIGMPGHKPLSLLGPLSYFIVPLRDPVTLQQARFDRAAWIRSATATLPSQVLAIAPAGTTPDGTPRIKARLFGLNIHAEEDPPIGSAMPALASFLSLSNSMNPLRFVALRGMGHERLSTLQVRARPCGPTALKVSVGGAVTSVARGHMTCDL